MLKLIAGFVFLRLGLGLVFAQQNFPQQLNEISTENSPLLTQLFENQPPEFRKIIQNARKYQLQIIYTQINRDEQNRPYAFHHTYRLDTLEYFYPASMVKIPCAALALEKINELNVPELDAETPMKIDKGINCQTANSVAESRDGRNYPSVANYIKDALVVSGNVSYSRLYEFLGQQYLNEKLQAKGYQAQITQRYTTDCSLQEHKVTNPITFLKNGRIIYKQPLLECKKTYRKLNFRNMKSGPGKTYDISGWNYISLSSMHEMMMAMITPEVLPEKKRFLLKPDDYKILHKYLSMTPPESVFPAYETNYYNYGRLKYLLFGNTLKSPNPNIRIFNKVGLSFNYITDCAYIVDFEKGVEFYLSATVYLHDIAGGEYEYLSVGMPFMQQLGQLILDYERSRPRPFKPDLSALKLEYAND